MQFCPLGIPANIAEPLAHSEMKQAHQDRHLAGNKAGLRRRRKQHPLALVSRHDAF